MVLENGRLRKGQYWDIDPNHAIRHKTDEEFAEHFLSLFKEAIRARLRGHGPIIHVVEGGRLVESGTWDRLVANKNGRFLALCQAQGISP